MATDLTDGKWRPARHLVYLSNLLVEAALGTGSNRILVDMPPRHGKSVLCSHYFPVWYLELFPEKIIAVASYAKEFAAEWGRKVRNTIEAHADELTVRIAQDSSAAGKWNTPEGGGMYCVGIEGGLTGRGVDLGLVDDPFKDRKAANSPLIRRRVHDWWRSTLVPRLEPGAACAVIQTRWHEADLIGHLQAQETQHVRALEDGTGDEDFDRWTSVHFPAIAEEGDVLGREPPGVDESGRPVEGEPLWPERWNARRLRRKRLAVGPFEWAALFQGRPQPAGDQMFERSWFRYFRIEQIKGRTIFALLVEDGAPIRIPASDCTWYQTVDTAEDDKEGNDYTAIGTWCVAPSRRNLPPALLLVEMARSKLSIPRILPFVEAARSRWPLVDVTGIEAKSSGTGILQAAQLRGLPYRKLEALESKASRAAPLAVFYENGQVYHREGAHYLVDFEEELLAFPFGANDDQVDVAAHAGAMLRTFGGIRYF